MKLSIFQLAQLSGWYIDFEAAKKSENVAAMLMQFGVLAGILDGVFPDQVDPKPRDMDPPTFIRFVGEALPLLIAANAPMVTEFVRSSKMFSESMSAIVKARDSKQ